MSYRSSNAFLMTRLQTPGKISVVLLGLLLSARPFIRLFLRFALRDSVAFLDAPDQLILLPGDGLPVIVGELAPMLPWGGPQLFPPAFDFVPIHASLLPSSRYLPIEHL